MSMQWITAISKKDLEKIYYTLDDVLDNLCEKLSSVDNRAVTSAVKQMARELHKRSQAAAANGAMKKPSRARTPPEDRATNDRILQELFSTRRVLQQLPGMLVQRLQSCPMGLDNLVAIAAARQRFFNLVIGEREKLVSLARTVYGRAPTAPAKTSRGSRRGKNTPVLKIVRQKAKGFHDGIVKHVKLGKRIPGTPKILDQPFHAPTVTTKAMKATKK